MTINEYIASFEAAQTADQLEAAIQAWSDHPWHGPRWRKICQARIAAGERICRAHENGFYVPMIGPRRKLEVCGETRGVGYGQNGAGERYVWTNARQWAVAVLKKNGISQRAAHQIWDRVGNYPHRALAVVAAARAGKIRDPRFGYLYRHKRTEGAKPIRYSLEQNNRDKYDWRAHRPCPTCKTGILFDWGAGHSEGFNFINWHCNGCPDVFTQYLREGQLPRLRARPTCEAIAA
jgi:hypothetical protein